MNLRSKKLSLQAGVIAVFGSLLIGPAFDAQTLHYPGKPDSWQGYARYRFGVDGRYGYVVAPKTMAPGRPWVWRARFPNFHTEVDLILLEKGYHVAYMDVAKLYGSPAAVRHWDVFYAYITDQLGLADKPVLEGVSRGGLIVYNWAAKNPEKVACIYCDTPVCDFKSWPAGKGKGLGSENDWTALLKEYGFTEQQALEFKSNPIDQLEPLARKNIPILHIVSESDQVVPPVENTYILRHRYEALGGSMEVISIPQGTEESNGHHFPVENPQPMADFILKHSATTPYGHDYYQLRDPLKNCRGKFVTDKKGRVAFLGGSITYNLGWRELTGHDLQKRFPKTDFEFINAGIPSTGSTPGAFRLERDVLDHGPVDLLFVEAAVNDSVNGRTDTEQIRAMEGIIRHARRDNPHTDIVMLYFVDPDKMTDYNEGKTPTVIANHDRVAAYYHVSALDLAREVTERIRVGEFDWENDFRNLHPSPFGQRIYYRSIQRLMDAAWTRPLSANEVILPHVLPEKSLDEKNYERARLIRIQDAAADSGWTLNPNWQLTDKVKTRAGFVNVPMLISEQPGATLTLKFSGTAVGIWVAAGPDAGIVEYRIDGRNWKSQDLFTRWSKSLHLPWAYILDAGLSNAPHELTIRVGESKNHQSRGQAVRIVHFLVN